MKIIITEQEAIEAWKTCNGSHGKETLIEIEREDSVETATIIGKGYRVSTS